MDDVVVVSLGGRHNAAITEDGSLYMWGHNDCGQLGDGTTEDKLSPVKVLDDVVSVSLGGDHSGAITEDGSLYMWGDNSDGQLGDGTTEKYKSSPVKVLDDVVSVSLGNSHSGAITKDGSLYMWGCNELGELGDGTTEDKSSPVKVMDHVVSVSLGLGYSGAITKDGTLYMWGFNAYGQLGDGTTEYMSSPVKTMSNVVSVSLGSLNGGAIAKDGSLYMWGYNRFGNVGDGTAVDKLSPVKVLDDVVSVSLGADHGGAITKDGTLYMWGDNAYGQLGDGTMLNKYRPVKVMDHIKISTGTTAKTKLTTKNTTIKLSKKSYTYDGKAKKPTVKVYNSKGKVLKSKYYTVTYKNNTKVGKAIITIKFKGKYTGTIKATYTIKPKETTLTGKLAKTDRVTLTWKKQTKQVNGYQIQYATNKKFTKNKKTITVANAKTSSKTVSGLNSGTTYYFRIRTYKNVDGKKYYSNWSNYQKVSTKKKKFVSTKQLVGEWTVDTDKTMKENGVSMWDLYGTSIKYGYKMVFYEDGTFSWYIAWDGGTGTYKIEENTVTYNYKEYEGKISHKGNFTVQMKGEDIEYMVLDIYDGENQLYWEKMN
jgi:hypothetical protein